MKFSNPFRRPAPSEAAPNQGGSSNGMAETPENPKREGPRVTFEAGGLSTMAFSEDSLRVNDLLKEETPIEGGMTDKERRKNIRLSRKFAALDPLVGQAINLYTTHAVGLGFTVQVTSEDKALAERAQELIDIFSKEPTNIKHMSPIGQRKNSDRLAADGNWFVTLRDLGGGKGVRIRRIDTLQVESIINNPLDSDEVWFYVREFSIDGKTVKILYKDISIKDTPDADLLVPVFDTNKKIVKDQDGKIEKRPFDINEDVTGDASIEDGVFMIHGSVFSTGVWGNPLAAASLVWAKTFRTTMEDRVTLRKERARYAWKDIINGGKAVIDAARAALKSSMTAFDSRETNPPPPTGSTRMENEGRTLEPVKSNSDAPDAEIDLRAILQMFCIGVHLMPQLFGTESRRRETQQAIEGPTLRVFASYQQVLASIYEEIFAFVLVSAGIDMEKVKIELTFPPIKERERPATIEMLDQITNTWPEFIESEDVKALALTTAGLKKAETIIEETKDLRPDPVAPPAPEQEREPVTAADMETRLTVMLSQGLACLAEAKSVEFKEGELEHV